MGQKLFTSGEFAKFCNTTKDTLFHYDDINLVMYSHHFRYRLEVGASCSIQLLL